MEKTNERDNAFEQTGRLTYIPVSELHPHPNNPRKNVGDVSELAESIKVNGVLQNLTVVPDREGYKVIIGHRRLAASKLAGLETVPCAVVEMSEKEQASTMLTENMQRSDLTVYEQAQGFQFLLDLGESVESIAEKAGFSASTVRRRVKLLELDKEKFKQAEARGATLMDYAELDKLKSPERKNRVLEYIGTENFRLRLRSAMLEEVNEANKQKWIAYMRGFASEVKDRTGYETVVSGYWKNNEISIKRPFDADKVKYYFCAQDWGGIYLLKEREASEKDEEAERQRERRERAEMATAGLKVLEQQAWELRREFIEGLSTAFIREHLADFVALMVCEGDYIVETSDCVRAIGELIELNCKDEAEWTLEKVVPQMKQKPIEKIIARLIYFGSDGENVTSNSYVRQTYVGNGIRVPVWCENKKMDVLYEFLERLGYRMADEEKALQNGTHELFYREENGK